MYSLPTHVFICDISSFFLSSFFVHYINVTYLKNKADFFPSKYWQIPCRAHTHDLRSYFLYCLCINFWLFSFFFIYDKWPKSLMLAFSHASYTWNHDSYHVCCLACRGDGIIMIFIYVHTLCLLLLYCLWYLERKLITVIIRMELYEVFDVWDLYEIEILLEAVWCQIWW